MKTNLSTTILYNYTYIHTKTATYYITKIHVYNYKEGWMEEGSNAKLF